MPLALLKQELSVDFDDELLEQDDYDQLKAENARDLISSVDKYQVVLSRPGRAADKSTRGHSMKCAAKIGPPSCPSST